jgi:hypothetical protein
VQQGRDKSLACFLCGRAIPDWEFPPHCAIVGDIADATKAVGCPLCERCRELPQMLRWNRCMKMLRAMHSRKPAKTFTMRLRR